MFDEAIHAKARAVLDACREAGVMVAIAESCTGGLVAGALTEIAGSSDVVERGFVTYSYESKSEMLGVPAEMIAAHGAVSEPVAEAMARGASAKFDTDYAVAVTGIAGPAGGSPDKPIGLVYLAVAEPGTVTVRRLLLGADAPRHIIRERAAMSALNLLRSRLLRGGQQESAD